VHQLADRRVPRPHAAERPAGAEPPAAGLVVAAPRTVVARPAPRAAVGAAADTGWPGRSTAYRKTRRRLPTGEAAAPEQVTAQATDPPSHRQARWTRRVPSYVVQWATPWRSKCLEPVAPAAYRRVGRRMARDRATRGQVVPGPLGTPGGSRPGRPAGAGVHCAGPEAAGAVVGSGSRSQPTLIPL
jgi:hypothetical protein